MDKSSSKLALLVVLMVIASGLELCAEARNIAVIEPDCIYDPECANFCCANQKVEAHHTIPPPLSPMAMN
ncbi:hypothetical protein L3X38_035583 [Prunus dulcis]|uniref:Uncharacterized protein n=1 Tax=Prunus dulcis TaxID=3755 RepID=A0AAD4VLG7_PRUDU|nr:hypothetical protein L3X38_035583 [Prunus dulcis]